MYNSIVINLSKTKRSRNIKQLEKCISSIVIKFFILGSVDIPTIIKCMRSHEIKFDNEDKSDKLLLSLNTKPKFF